MREVSFAAAFTLLILLSTPVVTQTTNFVFANPKPYKPGWVEQPDANTQPPTITITNTTVNGNNLIISYTAKVGESTTAHTTHLDNVSYTSDWNQNKIYVYREYDPAHKEWGSQGQQKEISYVAEITGIPDGTHTLTMYVDEYGSYIIDMHLCSFYKTSSVSFNFTIDTAAPNVTVLSLGNTTYGSSDVPLSFSVNEETSSISYVLDDKDEVLIDGNTTLTGLSDGMHKVTVYACDVEGNVGFSETITFNVASFPVVPAVAGSIAVLGVGLLVYFKKRKR